mmetsp:Transcript_68734/g.143539  ORF Transcript_68734/g.143539 Transcript_68734/m.143539 type:complete len:84 (-) Transcript_68734:320-571(-)
MRRAREGTCPSLLLTEIINRCTQSARSTTAAQLINEEQSHHTYMQQHTQRLCLATAILTVQLLQVAVQKLIAEAHTHREQHRE